jgi:hypothetical protein
MDYECNPVEMNAWDIGVLYGVLIIQLVWITVKYKYSNGRFFFFQGLN